jgi:hypothetical protein
MEQQYYEAIGIHTPRTVRAYLIPAAISGWGGLTPPSLRHPTSHLLRLSLSPADRAMRKPSHE